MQSTKIYSRQIKLVGKRKQKEIEKLNLFILGAGANGSHLADLLVRSGVKKLTVVDRDVVEESNLQAQIYKKSQLLKPKVEALKENLLEINSGANIETHFCDFEKIKADDFSKFDILIDCADNIYSRALLNEVAVKFKKPFLHTASIGYEGRVALFKKACFSCYFKIPKEKLPTCEDFGVVNSTIALTASIALQNIIAPKEDELFFFNLKNNEFDCARIEKNENCEVCKNGKFELLNSQVRATKLCGANSVHLILGRKISDKIKIVKNGKLEFLLLPNGEAVARGTDNENVALREINKIINK